MYAGKHATIPNDLSPVLSRSQPLFLSYGGDWVQTYQVQNTSLGMLV